MTTPKPGRGPDTEDGRRALLARLQLMKSEVDAVVEPGHHFSIILVEIEGGTMRIAGVAVGPGQAGRLRQAPQSDPRLEGLEELWSISFEMSGYQDFEDRTWLRGALRRGQHLTPPDGVAGIERCQLVELDAEQLQRWLRKAILAVCDAVQSPVRRRNTILERDVRDVMITVCDIVRAKQRNGRPRRQPDLDFCGTREQFGLGRAGKTAKVGDPPRSLSNDRVRQALTECAKRQLLRASGKTSNRRYKVTKGGWDFAHRTIGEARLRACLISGPVLLADIPKILAGTLIPPTLGTSRVPT